MICVMQKIYGISRKKQIEIIGELQERKKLLQSLTDGGEPASAEV